MKRYSDLTEQELIQLHHILCIAKPSSDQERSVTINGNDISIRVGEWGSRCKTLALNNLSGDFGLYFDNGDEAPMGGLWAYFNMCKEFGVDYTLST